MSSPLDPAPVTVTAVDMSSIMASQTTFQPSDLPSTAQAASTSSPGHSSSTNVVPGPQMQPRPAPSSGVTAGIAVAVVAGGIMMVAVAIYAASMRRRHREGSRNSSKALASGSTVLSKASSQSSPLSL